MADTHTSDAFVEFDRVQKSYDGETLVVKDLNLVMPQGEFLTMLGPSGSGKTTCLMMLAGFETATHGDIRLDGVSISLALRDDDGVLLGFFVVRSEGDPDACWSRATLLDRVKSVFPRASYLPSRHAPDLSEEDDRIPMYTVDPDGSVALVKPAEGMLYVGHDSVLD